MATEKKTSGKAKTGRKEEAPAEKPVVKAKLKAMKGERDAAIAGKDKKKLKQVRTAMKRLKRQLKHAPVPAAPPAKEEPKPEEASS